jgi:hypothetical protein
MKKIISLLSILISIFIFQTSVYSAEVSIPVSILENSPEIQSFLLKKMIISGQFDPIPKKSDENYLVYSIEDKYIYLSDIQSFAGIGIKLANIKLYIEVPISVLDKSVPETFPNSSITIEEVTRQKTWREYNEPLFEYDGKAYLTIAERIGLNFKAMTNDIYVLYKNQFGLDKVLTRKEFLIKKNEYMSQFEKEDI